jgi:hypothetical protein
VSGDAELGDLQYDMVEGVYDIEGVLGNDCDCACNGKQRNRWDLRAVNMSMVALDT